MGEGVAAYSTTAATTFSSPGGGFGIVDQDTAAVVGSAVAIWMGSAV